VLTDLVIADEREAAEVARAPAPSERWPGMDLEGLDQVKLASLWALLAGREFRVETIEEFAALHEVAEDGPWVFRFPAPLAQLLADLDDVRAAKVARAWAETDELALDERDEASVADVLRELRALARSAQAERKALLLWMSL
jgi:hypothetical protein